MKEGRVLPLKPADKPDPVYDPDPTLEPGVSPGWKAFTIVLVISLLVFTVMAMLFVPKIRGRILPKDPKPASTGESSPPPYPVSVLREISRTDGATQTPGSKKNDKETLTEKETEIPDWEKMVSCKVAITSVETTVYYLEIGEKRDRVTCSEDIEDKTQFVHALCKERFSSGCYYWEIKPLTEPYTEKGLLRSTTYECPTSWYAGVTSKSAEKKRKVPLTPQNDYWVLQYDEDKGYYVNDPSLTPVLVRAMFVLWMMFNINGGSVEGTFSLLVPDGYISARIGSSVVLPCGLSTTLDIKSYEVNWHRPNKKEDPVLLYKDQMVQENTGDPQYRGRVSLIGELENGNVSLKVENLTLADRGEYVCLVKSTEWYERASVNLNITVVGSPPLLSLAESGEEVNVTCVADGWSPNPILNWRDKKGKELRATVDHYTNSVGLVSVSSWLLVSPSGSEWISCSVGLSDQEMKEGRVLPPKMAYNPDSVNDPDSLEPGLSSGWKAFTILLVISLLVFTVVAMLFIPKIRGSILPKESKPASTGKTSSPPFPVLALREINKAERATQTPAKKKSDKGTNTEKEIPDWEKMRAHKVAIRPVTPTAPSLEVGKKNGDRVTCTSDVQDKTEFVHVLCEERFRSGRYYWEIKTLIEPFTTKDFKTRKCSTSWYVGVTSESAEKRRKVPVTPQNGYWVLQYDEDKGYYVNDPSLTPVLVRDRFSKLGVFIDCKKHTLSFYDCDKQTHLYTFYNVPSSPTSPLIPMLSPGDKKGDTIMICQEKCVQCDELYP
ncbi:hypothetical protein NFI96_009212 [Prochilodus magdalenae]|nr:hypothetical protein NFI96_009212 [Prochilodus magdalenae]